MSRRIEGTIILLLLLLAFGLRAFRLDLQSIWYDEGFSINLARQDWGAILALSVDDIHPPLHALLLHLWVLQTGDSEFSVRYLSLFFGVLTVPVLFQLGRLLLGRRGALFSLLVAVLTPFLIYYSQEARPYSLALFLSVLSVFAALKWVRAEGSRAWLLGYAGAAAAAAYTHYYAWLVIASLNLFALLGIWAAGRQALGRLRSWLEAQAMVGLAYLPWAGVLLQKYDTYATPIPGPDIGLILYQTLASFGLGYTAGQAGVTPGQLDLPRDHWVVLSLSLALLAVAVGGLFSRRLPDGRGKEPLAWAFLPLYLALPLVLIILLSWGRRYFEPRYLIFAAPAYYLLLGKGLDSLLGRSAALGTLATLLVIGASALSLGNYYFDPVYWRDDVRGTVQFIQGRSKEGDVVILNAYYLRPTFIYYYRGEAPVLDLPTRMSPNWDQELPTLEEMHRQYGRIWLVLWQDYFTDPQRQVQGWLEERALRFQHRSFRGPINVLGYLSRPPIVEGLPPGQPAGLQLGSTVELVAYQLPEDPICAGREMPVTLYWRALQPIAMDYTVFVHLVDERGRTLAQADSQPAEGGFPTTRWPVGSLVADERWVGIPSDAPPGQYSLETGMYDLATMKRLGEGDPKPFQYALGPLQVLSEGCKE